MRINPGAGVADEYKWVIAGRVGDYWALALPQSDLSSCRNYINLGWSGFQFPSGASCSELVRNSINSHFASTADSYFYGGAAALVPSRHSDLLFNCRFSLESLTLSGQGEISSCDFADLPTTVALNNNAAWQLWPLSRALNLTYDPPLNALDHRQRSLWSEEINAISAQVRTQDYRIIYQANHGFVAGNGIASTATGWQKSSTSRLDIFFCLGVVDANQFLLPTREGEYYLPNHGYPLRKMLYLGATEGVFTDTPPAQGQTPPKRIVIGQALDADHFFWSYSRYPI